ncbi:Protein HHL1, chloroplastic [Linum perenne]
MEVGMSLNALARLPLSTSARTHEEHGLLFKFKSSPSMAQSCRGQNRRSRSLFVVEAKGKRGMANRQFPKAPLLPKIEEDGNPNFVIFIRMANVNIWYPLSIISGGTTAKIMVAAKDNFLGKYIYRDTLARNLATVIYRDEKEIRKTAVRQHRILRSATEFRYGYKLVENANIRAALSVNNVIELPTPDKLKTVVDKVKDFFSDTKESFGKLTSLDSTSEAEEPQTEVAEGKEKAKVKG